MLASSYPRNDSDSASIFLRHLAESLKAQNLAIHVLAPADKVSGEKSENGIIVHRFRYFFARWQKLAYGSGVLSNLKRNPLLWLQVPLFIGSMFFSLLWLLNRIRPDVIHAHWVIPQGLLAVFAKSIYKIPVVITVHGTDAFALKSKLLEWIKRIALSKCDAWTSNTHATANSVLIYSSTPKPHIIPMGVDIQRFASGDRQKLRAQISDSEYIILFVGRLVEKKGVTDLITAFSLLPSAIQQKTRLWIIGDGDQSNQLRALSKELALSDKITFLGMIPNYDLPDYYSAADLFVAPSIIEGQGVVFLEAAAAKLCVVSTSVGGISEVIDDGVTGILVAPEHPGELAQSIGKILTDQSLRQQLAEQAYRRLVDTYSWDSISKDFKQLFQELSRSIS